MRITAVSFRRLAVMASLVVFPVSSAFAQEASPAPMTLDVMPIDVLSGLMRNGSAEEFSANLLNHFRSVAGPDGVLSAQSIADRAASETASRRASKIAEILNADLDGDGAVTREELGKSKSLRYRNGDSGDETVIQAGIAKEVERAMAADANGDSTISFDEMRAAAQEAVAVRNDSREDRAGALLAMDGDGDGTVTIREVRAAARAIFARYDTDGDGEISELEKKALADEFKMQMERRQLRSMITGCAVPPVPEGVRFVLLSTGRGLDVPTVSVAGMDETTWSGEIAVQPGDEKLWVVASANDPMIWRLSGAVDRIERFVVIPDRRNQLPAAGVVGLPKEKVAFTAASECHLRSFLQTTRARPETKEDPLRDAFGRVPDDIVAVENFVRTTLPDGAAVTKPESEPERPTAVPEAVWENVRRFGSGVAVPIDPANVVATGKAEAYDVLPEESGLIQLIVDGSIVPRAAGSGTQIDITPEGLASKSYRDYVYEIVKPIPRFPAGLAGAHAVKFRIAEGVPLPGGSAGHSCVRDSAGNVLAMKILCGQ